MANYFSNFPKVYFDNKTVTDLVVRIKARAYWLNNPLIYYNYIYQDYDKPEHIAKKYYNDEYLHWIILVTNNIFDVNFDLPMNSYVFANYIEDKYKELGALQNRSGMEYAQITPDPIYRYQKEVKIISSTSAEQTNYYVIDDVAFENLSFFEKQVLGPDGEYLTYREGQRLPQVTIYDREFEVNESKRLIKILKKDYVQQAKNELTNLLR